MGLFSKSRKRERAPEEPIDVEKAIATISARQVFLEALATNLVAELSDRKRGYLLGQLEEVVRGWMIYPPPAHVPRGKLQDFQDELRRAMRVLIEKATEPKEKNRPGPQELRIIGGASVANATIRSSSNHSLKGDEERKDQGGTDPHDASIAFRGR